MLRRNRARPVLAHAEADAQVLLDGQLRKDLAPLRHVADAEAGARSRPAARRRSVPSNVISPDVAGSRPMMHFSSVVLPMPLRPIRQVREPCGTVEVDVPQRVAAAVRLVERLDRSAGSCAEIHLDDARIVLHLVHVAFGEHAALRAARSRGWRSSARTPCRARRRPPSACRRATAAAPPCARSPAASCRRPARRPAAAPGPASAACRSRATASGRATACPPATSRCGARPIDLEHLVDALALRRRQPRDQRLPERLVAGQRQLEVLEHGQVLEHRRLLELAADAGLRDLAARVSVSRSTFWPNQAEPASGRVLPVMTSIIVVLPAPFGPMMQRSSPGST